MTLSWSLSASCFYIEEMRSKNARGEDEVFILRVEKNKTTKNWIHQKVVDCLSIYRFENNSADNELDLDTTHMSKERATQLHEACVANNL